MAYGRLVTHKFNHRAELRSLKQEARRKGYPVTEGRFLSEDSERGYVYRFEGDNCIVDAWFDASGSPRFEPIFVVK